MNACTEQIWGSVINKAGMLLKQWSSWGCWLKPNHLWSTWKKRPWMSKWARLEGLWVICSVAAMAMMRAKKVTWLLMLHTLNLISAVMQIQSLKNQHYCFSPIEQREKVGCEGTGAQRVKCTEAVTCELQCSCMARDGLCFCTQWSNAASMASCCKVFNALLMQLSKPSPFHLCRMNFVNLHASRICNVEKCQKVANKTFLAATHLWLRHFWGWMFFQWFCVWNNTLISFFCLFVWVAVFKWN